MKAGRSDAKQQQRSVTEEIEQQTEATVPTAEQQAVKAAQDNNTRIILQNLLPNL
jgi:hypothetical protein